MSDHNEAFNDIVKATYWSLTGIGGLMFLARATSYFWGFPTGFYQVGPRIYDLFMFLPAGLVYFNVFKKRIHKNQWLLTAAPIAYLTAKVIRFVVPDDNFADPLSLAFGLVAGVIVSFLLANRTDKSTEAITKRDIPKQDPGNAPLTVDQFVKFVLPTSTLHYHVQVIGGTGTGKTRYVLKPFIFQDIVLNRIGGIVFDVKSVLMNDIVYYVKKAGRMDEFVYFDPGNPEWSLRWNPLAYGTADEISNRIYCALYYDADKASQYYSNLAKSFLSSLVALMKMEHEILTFEDLFLAVSETESFKIVNGLCARHKESHHAKYFYENWVNKPKKERQQELSGLLNKLKRFCTLEWTHLLNTRTPDIRFNEIIDQGHVLLFGTASQKYPADSQALSIMALMELNQQVGRRYNEKTKSSFRLYLDEFYNLAYKDFIDILNKSREAHINCILAHQSIADLKMISPEFAEQFSTNTRTKIILAQDDSSSAEFFSQLIGTDKVKDRVYSYDTRQGLIATAAGYAEPEVHKFRVNPDTLKELPLGYAVVRTVFPDGPYAIRVHLTPAEDPPDSFSYKDCLKADRRPQVNDPSPYASSLKGLSELNDKKGPESPTGEDPMKGLGRARPPKMA